MPGCALHGVECSSCIILSFGKMLVKTGLSVAMPPGCYGKIAPRSGLALKKFIDVGGGVIDADYRGELGVLLLNCAGIDFQINVGDKITKLIFQRIKTPTVLEVDILDHTDRGNQRFRSTCVKTNSESVNSVIKNS